MRIAALIGLVLAAALAASASAARDPKLPRQQHTAADSSRANSIALKLSELGPAWSVAPRDKIPRCSSEPDESALVQTARVDRTYVSADASAYLGTQVSIFRTAAQAGRDWRLATLKVVRDCLLERARELYARQHIAVRLLLAVAMKPPTRGDRSLHYRIVLLLSAGKRALPQVTDVVGLGLGRISVFLRATSSPAEPITGAVLRSITGLLAARLVVAAGGI
jgi:hypothetical protein